MKSNENGYSQTRDYIPDTSHSNAVGDTEVLGSFLEKFDITDVTWVLWRENPMIEDCLQVSIFQCLDFAPLYADF